MADDDAGKVLNAEVDIRSFFSPFDFPKLPEIIKDIESKFTTDITKVVKALWGPLMGVYRIEAKDYVIYKDATIKIRNLDIPIILRTKQHNLNRREGILVTVYDAFAGKAQQILGNAFDAYFLDITGMKMIRQTTPQYHKNTRVLNGNRYFVADFDPTSLDLGESVAIGGSHFRIQYEGMQRYCHLCALKHGKRCAAKEKFAEMREKRQGKVTHKIYCDSTLRNANQLALATDIACTSGGGIGQIANVVHLDPEKKDNIIIFAGANEIKKSENSLGIRLYVR